MLIANLVDELATALTIALDWQSRPHPSQVQGARIPKECGFGCSKTLAG
jgi:hypothetical protein